MRTSINATTRFATALNQGKRYYKVYATITLYGTLPQGQQRVYELDNETIIQNGVKLEQSTSENNKFTVGSFILDKLTLTLYNDDGRFNDPIFTNADVDLVISLDGLAKNDGVQIGRFKVTNVTGRNTSLISLVCMDYGVKLNKPYVGSPIVFGSGTTAKAIDIVHDCLSQCSVDCPNNLASMLIVPDEYFPNPEDGEITCGQVISAIAQLNCRYVKMDANGELTFRWYHGTADATVNNVFGFTYGSEELHYTGIKLKTEAKHRTNTTASGQQNQETMPYISTAGESDYMYVIENNPMLQLKLNNANSNTQATSFSDAIKDRIWAVLSSRTFTPVKINALWNPFLEAGDTITTSLRIGGTKRTVTTVINNVSWSVGGQATYSCEAEIPSRNVSQSMSATSIVERQLKKLLKQHVSDFQNAYDNMLSDIAHATGFHVTEITQSGGSVIQYYHNGNPDVDRDGQGNIIYIDYEDETTHIVHREPSFSTATFLIKHAGSVIAASTDNGETWNWAINVDGNFIAQQIATHKLIADQALIGDLTVRKYCDDHLYEEGEDNTIMMQLTLPYIDDLGNEHLGRALLNADQVSITSGLSDGQLKTLAQAFEETSKVWFSNEEPTANNYPASSWTTDAVRLQHVGDICVNAKNGKSYRYEHLVQGQYYKFSQDSELAVHGSYSDEITIYYQRDGRYYKAGTFKGKELSDKKFFVPSNKMYMYYKSYDYEKAEYRDNTGTIINGTYFAYDSKGFGTLDDLQVESLPNIAATTVSVSNWQTISTRSAWLQNDIGNVAYGFNKHNTRRTNGYIRNEERRYDITTHTDSDFATNFGVEKYAWQEIENYELNTPAKILEKLTDGFAMEGIYMQNGKLYINMSYLRSGAIQIASSTNPSDEILYAGYDSSVQKNVLRMTPDLLTITANNFKISSGGSDKTFENYLQQDLLTQAKLIELINGNALQQGLYLLNGQLYISFNYARGGELALGGAVTGSSSDETANTYEKGKLTVYSGSNPPKVVGFWAGSSLCQYREKANNTYHSLNLTRTWEKTTLHFLVTNPAEINYIFKDYNVVGYNKSSGAYTASATNAYSTSYNYYSVREQLGAGYKLCTDNLEIYGGSVTHDSINDSSSSNSYTKPVVSLGATSQRLSLDLIALSGSFGSISGYVTGLDIKLASATYRHVNDNDHTLFGLEGFNRFNSGYNYWRAYTGYPWRFKYDTYFDSYTYYNNYTYYNQTVYYEGSALFYNTMACYYKDSENVSHVAFQVSSSSNGNISCYRPLQIGYISPITSSATLALGSNNIVGYISASSKRIKDIDRKLNESDIEALYDISVYCAKYKDGYLSESDQRNGKYYPMFIAEDVEEFFPDAVDLDEDGNARDWNYRVLVPAMFQMIKSQKEELTAMREEKRLLADKVSSLEDRLKKLETLLLNES